MKYKVLVNKENKIKDKFLTKIELITTKDVDNLDVQVEKETYNAYLKLKDFLATKDVTIGIASAYRSKEYQQEIYDEYIKKYGKDYADKVVEVIDSEWLEELKKINEEDFSYWKPKHYILYLDGFGMYQFIAQSLEVEK